ncbi:MAG: hypothetical protein ACEQSK_18345, partial [Sphingomonadaceae bacterium]
MKPFKLPHTFVLLFAILALIAGATWLVPGGRYETHLVNGRQVIDPASFHAVASAPQGLPQLLMAPIKGFSEAALIIGFVLIVGGAFHVLQRTEAIDALIRAIARAHHRSPVMRVALIPLCAQLARCTRRSAAHSNDSLPPSPVATPSTANLGRVAWPPCTWP